MIAGVDADVGTFRLVGRIEDERRLVDDGSRRIAVTAISDALTAGVDRFEVD